MKKHLTLCAASLLALSVTACGPEPRTATDLPPGEYKNVTRSTDSAGTTTVKRDTTTVGVDAYGNKRAVVSSKKTTDPKGLFNKSTNESTTVVEED